MQSSKFDNQRLSSYSNQPSEVHQRTYQLEQYKQTDKQSSLQGSSKADRPRKNLTQESSTTDKLNQITANVNGVENPLLMIDKDVLLEK